MLLGDDAAGTDYSGAIYDADDTNSADAEILLRCNDGCCTDCGRFLMLLFD
jgi:hypothetical protein